MSSPAVFPIFLLAVLLAGPCCGAQSGQLQALPATRPGAYRSAGAPLFSFAANTAALAGCKTFTAGFYGERRALLKALSLYQLAAAAPTAAGNFGLQAAYFGSVHYSETKVGVAHARHLGPKVSVGLQFNYWKVQIAGYGGAGAVNCEAGLLFHLTGQLHAGFQVYNPGGTRLRALANEKLPLVLSGGIGYEAAPHLFLGAEVIKGEGAPVDLQASVLYRPDKKLAVRAGYATATAAFYFGAALAVKDCTVDVSLSCHPRLGLTPGLALTFQQPESK